jgi:CubicO group peptidase (beta-lactamase class C family)
VEDFFGGRLTLGEHSSLSATWHRRLFVAAALGGIAQAVDPLEFEFQELGKRFGRAHLVIQRAGKIVKQLNSSKQVEQFPWSSARVLPISLCAAFLVDQGRLQWDAPVGKHFSQAESPLREVTLRQLLSHSAGVSAASCNDDPSKGLMNCVDATLRSPVKFRGGSKVSLSTAGVALASKMVERAVGQTLNELWNKQFAQPLKLQKDLQTTSALDLARLLEWLNGHQTWKTELFRDQAPKASLASTPYLALQRVQHPLAFSKPGLGVWVQQNIVSVPAASGLIGWIDTAHGTVGALAVQANLREALPVYLLGLNVR